MLSVFWGFQSRQKKRIVLLQRNLPGANTVFLITWKKILEKTHQHKQQVVHTQ
jgi:hypothetical protein